MILTFPILTIILSLITIFMVAGLYWWVFFGTIRFDLQNEQIESSTLQNKELLTKQLSMLTEIRDIINNKTGGNLTN
jgi:hypothetical protein